ncbi:MAG: helix-turn-helix domain-containing protein [Candidatus Marinimicrobia bacterium]|nr:helix-turn-helix domain-containing protein [Candidatus Neomarinimicrobiota bacterium]
MRGEMEPGRSSQIEQSDVKFIREKYGLSQDKFAKLLGISASTLRNWEQGRRKPEGTARVLLRIALKHPEAVLDTVQ